MSAAQAPPFTPTPPANASSPAAGEGEGVPQEVGKLAHACAAGQLTTAREILYDYYFSHHHPHHPSPQGLFRGNSPAGSRPASGSAGGAGGCAGASAVAAAATTPEREQLRIFWPALLAAIQSNQPDIVELLLSVGLPLDSLHIWEAIRQKSPSLFDTFLQHGWDINQPLGRTQPPALAYVLDDRELTERFLNHGADPNAGCGWDLTPLSAAVRGSAPLATLQLLFQRGGDVFKGQLLHHAVERDLPDVLDVLDFLLRQTGAQLLINEIKYRHHLPSYNDRSFLGLGTPLHRAAELGREDVVRYLLQNGADCSIKDTKGQTAHDCALLEGHHHVARLLQRELQ